MTTKEMLAFKYVEDVAKSHKDAAAASKRGRIALKLKKR